MATRGRELRRGQVIDHDSSPTGRWLRERRVRVALWIAAIEGLLIVVHVINKWPAIIVAGAFLVAFFMSARSIKSDTGRQLAWILAASQALVVLVPIIFAFVKTIAYLIVAALAVLALVILFTGERSGRRTRG